MWKEVELDAFSYFQWFSKDEALYRLGLVPDLSLFSVVGSMLFTPSERMAFKDFCSTEIQNILKYQRFTNDYKLYLFANVEVEDINSKVVKYKKVWKSFKTTCKLETFIKGPEIELEIADKLFYSGIAQFSLKDFSTALDIISSNPKRYTIIASKNCDYLSEKSTRRIFDLAFNKHSKREDEIDYFGLSLYLCPKGDMVFRWGDSSEEAEIVVVLENNMLVRIMDQFKGNMQIEPTSQNKYQ